MSELLQILQSKRDWLASTTGAKKAPASLTLPDLDRIISALQQCENPALPKIEPRLLGQQEPRGTKRSQEYGGGNPYNSGGCKVLA